MSSVERDLVAATMKVSKSLMLLTGIVEAAVSPPHQDSARAHLDLLAEAVTDLRDVAASLGVIALD